MVIVFTVYGLSQVVLITAPDQGYTALILCVALQACCIAAVNPLVDQLAVFAFRTEDCARIHAILQVSIIHFTSPFSWIAGMLSELNKNLPFVLNLILFCVRVFLAYIVGTRMESVA